MASSAVSYARENQQKFLGELKDLLRIPSVSTAPEHKEDVRRAAMFVADEMRRIGMENVDVIPTKNHPLVYGDWLHAPGKPTVLCYAHYDVQPPDPLNEWLTPPLTIRASSGWRLRPWKRSCAPTTANCQSM
jgi:acetylornithine deacetylase/succinyl-diaminopimelate desuccinylase-like protein